MGIKLTNNANATLAASINSSATSITLTSGQGARFPTLSAGDYFYATLVDTSNNLEIVKCTARSTDVLTVVRAQESTTARAYDTGDRIEIRLTAQTFTDATSLPTQTGNSGKFLSTDGTSPAWASVTPATVSDQTNSSTGYFDLPVGTTAQRPGSPGVGMLRHNTSTGNPEWYDTVTATWRPFNDAVASTYQVEFLVIGGGGGGYASAYNDGGGGGAGGYRTSVPGQTSGGNASAEPLLTVVSGITYTVSIGAGGAGSSVSGSETRFGPIVAGGGAGAGSHRGTGQNGAGSGSGGGGKYAGGDVVTGGSGVAGQGNSGGTKTDYPGGGGGGGAGGAGGGGSGNGRPGGAGLSSPISGSSVGRGGGGGGSGAGSSASSGGGAGGSGSSAGTSGTANTGGGGGGSENAASSGSGGSGVVIIRYPGSQRGSGGSVTAGGSTTPGSSYYTVHVFNSSGTFTA